MNEIIHILLASVCGTLIGTLFFGGLWLTVKKGLVSKTPGLLFASSFFLRTGIVLLGFYYVSQGHWQNLLCWFLGFLTARIVIIRLTGRNPEKRVQMNKEAGLEA